MPTPEMTWSSALAVDASTRQAATTLVDDLRTQLRSGRADLLLLFVSPHYREAVRDLTAWLQEELPASVLVGCSAGGVIGGGHELEQQRAMSAVAATLPGVKLTPVYSDAAQLPDDDAPPAAWRTYFGLPDEPPAGFLLLADPFSVPAEAVMAGLDYAFPGVPKVGGLVSGGRRPDEGFLFLDQQHHSRGLVAVGLSGPLAMDPIVAQGCRPIGATLAVTRCAQHLLQEVDGRPPMEYLRELARKLDAPDRKLLQTSLFLGVELSASTGPPGEPDFLVRNLVGIDYNTGAIAVGAFLHEGQAVRFHLRDRRTSAEDLQRRAGAYAQQPGAPHARGALLFSCLGRGSALYGEPDHDSQLFRRMAGAMPVGGFFCNGEIGPIGAATCLHGYTSAFAVFRPVAPAPDRATS